MTVKVFCQSETLPSFYGDLFWRKEQLYVLFQDGENEEAVLRLARFCKVTHIWELVKEFALNMVRTFGGHFYPQKSAYLPWADMLLLFTQRCVFAIRGFEDIYLIEIITSSHPFKDKLLLSESFPTELKNILSAADQSTWAVYWSAPVVANDFKEKAVYAVAHVYSSLSECNHSCLFRLVVTKDPPIVSFHLLEGLDLKVKMPKYVASLGIVYNFENKINDNEYEAFQQLKSQKRTLVICYQTQNQPNGVNSTDILTSFNAIVSISIIEKF